MEIITITEAVRRYEGIKADRIRAWCQKGKINGAIKSGPKNEWHFSPTAFEDFLSKEYPELFHQAQKSSSQPSDPSSILSSQTKISSLLQEINASIKNNVLWDAIFSVFALPISLINDVVGIITLISIVLSAFAINLSDKTFRYIFFDIVCLVLCIISSYVLYVTHASSISGRKKLRYANPILRKVATVILPLLLIIFMVITWSFWQWVTAPPEKTVILVAEFIDLRDGVDSGKVTSNLIDSMNDILKKFPQIEVVRLNQPITEREGGSAQAEEIANKLAYKATIVIWGEYSSYQQETELTAHVDIIRESVTYYTGLSIYAAVGKNLSETYPQDQIELMANREQVGTGSTQIPRAKWHYFKLALSKRLGHLATFIEALALYSAGEHKSAIPLFEDATKAIKDINSDSLDRAIQFYEAANFIASGQIDKGTEDLLPLIPKEDMSNESIDSWGAIALAMAGMVAQLQGESKQSLQYLNRALAIYIATHNTFGHAETLKLLCLIHLIEENFQMAQTQAEAALGLYSQVSDNLGQGESLSLLGMISWIKSIKEKSNSSTDTEYYMERALKQFQQANNIIGKAQTYMLLAVVTQHESKKSSNYYSYAKSTYKKILGLNIPIYNQIALLNLGSIAMSQQDFFSAYDYFNRGLDEAKQKEDTTFQCVDLINLLLVDLNSRDFAKAQDRRIQISTHISSYKLWHLYPIYIAVLEIGTKLLSVEKDYLLIKDYNLEALQIYQSQGNVAGQIRELTNLSEAAYQKQEYDEVGLYFLETQRLISELKEPLTQDLARWGHLAFNMGEKAQNVRRLIDAPIMTITAFAYYSTAEEIFRKLGMKSDQAEVLGAIGAILSEQGEASAAKQYIKASIKIYKEIGYTIPSSILETSNKLNIQP